MSIIPDEAMQEFNTRLKYEQSLFKQTTANWSKIGSTPGTISIRDIRIVYQTIADMIVFAAGTDDIDETILVDVIVTLEKVLFELLDQKISESQLLIPDNYGKFVVSVDDMMPQGIIETLDAGLLSKLSKLKPIS